MSSKYLRRRCSVPRFSTLQVLMVCVEGGVSACNKHTGAAEINHSRPRTAATSLWSG